MSGVAGADRIKSRQDFQQFLKSYQQIISKFPGFQSLQPSGSYNSDPSKMDFGDIDIIVHITSSKDKATVKKELQAYLDSLPDNVIVPFTSAKHAGKRTYNAGELVSVRYHDNQLGYSAQIDNIVALDQSEATFKQQFLDMPAEKQGLVLGLVKIAAIETNPAALFQKLGITAPAQLQPDQEYEFNLSSVELQLRLVTYEPGTYKQADRKVLWTSRDFDDLQKLLYQYNLDANFDQLLAQSKQAIKNPRSNARMQGVFSSMITVKSGEVGTAKGAGKEAALGKIQQTFKESKSIFRSLMEADIPRKVVFAFGRFQPPTIGHELLINSVKQAAANSGADHVIYVSKTKDAKTNPLDIATKMSFLQKMFPGTNFVAADETVRTPIEALKHLNQTYADLTWMAGSDRVPVFSKLAADYNGKDYQYQHLNVVSSGSRDPDSEGVEGMSGTKMREAAIANNLQAFREGLPATMPEEDAMKLMNLIQQGLNKPVKAKPGVAEARQSNAVKLQKAWEREQQKSAASSERGREYMDKLKSVEPKKDTKQGVAEGADERKQNALWAQITAHEKAAKASKDLKRQHHINMADQLRSQLKTSDNEQGVAEGSYDDDKGITHTRGSLVAKLEALPKGSDDFEWNRIQAIHHLKQGNMLRAKYYMALMKRGEQGVAETALKNKQDLDAKRKALQDMEREPGHDKEAIRQRKLDLDKEARAKGMAESDSNVMANTASRLANKDDGKVAKLRAAGDKRREEHLKSRDIAKKNECAGVGIITKQNSTKDVNKNTPMKNLKAFNLAEESVEQEHIVKVKGGYELKSKHGNKNLGKYPTKSGAEKRERQVQYFKHAGEEVETEGKKKGADGKACWDNYRYNGTKNGKDSCVKVGEDVENIMGSLIESILKK